MRTPVVGGPMPAYCRAPLTLCAVAGLALSLLGCKTNPAKPTPEAPRTGEVGAPALSGSGKPMYVSLKGLSERQKRSPDERAQKLEPPPGVDAASVALLGEQSSTTVATMTVEEMTKAFTAAPEEAAPTPPAANSNPQAVRLYISGRSKLLEGQAARAVTDLEAASRLDPNSPEVWRELGQAQLELGRRTSAMASFQKAKRLGLSDPRISVLIAREDLRAKRFEDAARKLVAARASGEIRTDAGLAQLVDIDLAEAVGAIGYVRACRDLLASGLKTPIASISQSPLRNELAEVMRRRGDLWQRVGDLSCRLGEYDKAAAAYAEAAESPTLDPQGIIARRVYADLKRGQSADAALVVVEDIRASEGRVEDRHMGVISYLAQNTDVGPRLAEAISDVAQSGGTATTPTVLNRLARATAAALTGDAARGALRARIVQSPFDTDLVVEVLGSYAKDDVKGRLKECLTLVSAAPLATDVYAGVFLNRGQGIDATVKQLEGDSKPAARLFHAALLNRLARPELALARLNAAAFPEAFVPASLTLKTLASVASGRWDEANQAEQKLAGLSGAPAIKAHAYALRFLQRFDEALPELEKFIAMPEASATTEDLMLAAELALRCNQVPKAEEYLLKAMARDRFDERPYEPLVNLYAPNGPLQDEAKLTTTARNLRTNIPSSRLIRGINAQELVAKSLWSQAEPQLLSMLTEYNENGSVMNLLVTVWERAAESDPDLTARGEQWLRAKLAERPESSLMLTSLARVLAAEGKGAEAEPMLAARLAAWPLPDVARMREWLYREALEQPEMADKLARERIVSAPKGIENSIELAELYVHDDEVEKAAEALIAGIPKTVKLTGEQTNRLTSIVAQIRPDSLVRKNPEAIEGALHLLDLIASHGTMSEQMHFARLALLAAGHPEQTERLVGGVEELGKAFPQRRLEAYGRMLVELGKRSEPGPQLRFAGMAANRVTPPAPELYFEWYRLTIMRGEEADIQYLADNLKTVEACDLLMGTLGERNADEEPPPEDLAQKKAEIMYQMGILLTARGREELSEKAYRVALALNPTHAWAANNLGYGLLERGGDINEAERLIEIAYNQREDEPSIVDSMGWVLYKQGKLEDVTNEKGDVVKKGAITLLRQAAADNPDSGVLHDHAADALWRAGSPDQKDEALGLWQIAEAVFTQEMTLYQGDDAVNANLRRKAQANLDLVVAKIRAVKAGKEPELAPLAKDEVRTPPAHASDVEAPAKP